MLTGDADADELFNLLYDFEIKRCANPATHLGGRFDPKQITETLGWRPKRFIKAADILDDLDAVEASGNSSTHGWTGIELRIKGFAMMAQHRGDPWPKWRAAAPDKARRVFVISGRNAKAAAEVENYLRAMGIEPIEFERVRADLGGTPQIAEIVEEGMNRAQGVLALVTPDEFAALRPVHRDTHDDAVMISRWQARPNVIFEAGMAFGRDRFRFAFVLVGKAELFSDVAGIHLVRLNNNPTTGRTTLAHTLKAMGCAVNDSLAYQKAGDFESCVADGAVAQDPFGKSATSTARAADPPRVTDDDEARIILHTWAAKAGSESGVSKTPFRYSGIDETLGFQPGTSKRIVSDAVLAPHLKLAESAGDVFRVERLPARVREVATHHRCGDRI